MIANALIAARVTTDTKQRFAAVARQQGLSESTLLKRYIDTALLHASALPAPVMARRAGPWGCPGVRKTSSGRHAAVA